MLNPLTSKEIQVANRIIRLPEVIRLTGLSRSAIYQRMSENAFPNSIPLGGRTVGWLESEINDYLTQLVYEARDNSIAGGKQES